MESDFVAWLKRQKRSHPQLNLGIGDDAALLSLPSAQSVVTSDMLMDGTDFVLSECEPERVGRKALAVNLSDLAAMAAKPVAAIVSVAVPESMPVALLERLYGGLLALANEFDVALAGGDTNTWKHPFAISVTAIGEPTGDDVLTRAGAKPGDAIFVTGKFGGSILGHHFDFTPRVKEAIALHAKYTIHAAMDVSDGLSLDLSRLAHASECGAIINREQIPIADAAYRLAEVNPDSGTPLDHALSDGEDFELILVVPRESVECVVTHELPSTTLTCIGEIAEEPGLWIRDANGDCQPLEPRGYEH